ncbi:MAG: pyroglutamyl-peptidase I [Nitrososphaerota archaeon]|nr:pyroglutamyl-peptidase I [Nitrososphaerota archaeon]MDG6940196.1 pyroglutamyl-peptidase I [Nitrososphaerota archaeon]
MVKALLTGFEAWAGHKNPSGMIARELDGKVVEGVEVVGRELPEDFFRLPRITSSLVEELEPDIIISMGWDYGRAIRVEKVAINVQQSDFGDKVVPDNAGNSPRGTPVLDQGQLAYAAGLPAERVVEALRKAGIPAVLSYHAGTHCCNTVMYSFLHSISSGRRNVMSGFMHIPPLREMVKPEQPCMDFATELEGMRIALRTCASER